MTFSQREYSEIVECLAELESFLRALGLHKGPDRLRLLARNVATIDQAHRAGTLDTLSERADMEELVWSLVDAIEFIAIHAGLKNQDPTTIAPLFRKALQGTLHPGRETPYKSNLGRNTAFELRLASGLIQAGAQVQLGQRADIVIDHAGARVYVECKRPFAAETIRANIVEARKQLRLRMNADPHRLCAGFVAVSVSRAVNSGSGLFVAERPEGLSDLARDLIRLHGQGSADFDRLSDLRQLGVLYHIHTPAYVKSMGLLTAASEAAAFFSGPALQTTFPVSRGAPLKRLLGGAL